jgi:hypothetical protein
MRDQIEASPRHRTTDGILPQKSGVIGADRDESKTRQPIKLSSRAAYSVLPCRRFQAGGASGRGCSLRPGWVLDET